MLSAFHLQIWLEMAAPPSEDDVDMLDTVLTSWFMIGRLGGYNSMNLQARPLTSRQGDTRLPSDCLTDMFSHTVTLLQPK